MSRKIRMGMVGGGRGAFIGGVHRMAAALDGQIDFVAGALSKDPRRARLSGEELFLAPDRNYASYQEMLTAEAALPEDRRIDFVTIVTPNHMHFPVAEAALSAGFHVVCDKPMTFDLAQAKQLAALVQQSGLVFALTHNYTGYPMVKEARHLVASGRLGTIRRVVVEYPQGWLATLLESSGNKQASWRTDPQQAGASSCMGDIGTHAENLVEYVTGLKIQELCADLSTFVSGRSLDDDGNVLLRLQRGAKGVLFASQVAVGEENPLRIRVYGEIGGLEWAQEEPNTLVLKWPDQPRQLLRAGANYAGILSPRTLYNSRLPSGHPEGFIEAFANIYRNFALTLRCRLEGTEPEPDNLDFPTVDDGVRGMAFIAAVVESSAAGALWTTMKD